jgi:hypothetical protein
MSQSKPKKLSLKTVSVLPDAIVDGKLMCGIDSTLVIERIRSKKVMYCECIVKQLLPNGLVHVWDDTLEQWFVFEMHNPPPLIKILKVAVEQ